jgi:hypothetical protein
MSGLIVILIPAGIIAALICFRWARWTALLFVLFTLWWFTGAGAEDVRCEAPPYGDTVDNFRKFYRIISPLLDNPVNFLQKVCEAKYDHLNRRVLYNLGIPDEDIDSEPTNTLAAQVLLAEKHLANNPPN